MSVLRSVYLHLRDASRLSRLHTRILDALSQPQSTGAHPDIVVPRYAGEWTSAVSSELRTSLTAHLFGWNNIRSQRLRYAAAAFCHVCPRFSDASDSRMAP